MVSSLPVPTGLSARVWPDEAWQSALRDMAVVGDDPAPAARVEGTRRSRLRPPRGHAFPLRRRSAAGGGPVRVPARSGGRGTPVAAAAAGRGRRVRGRRATAQPARDGDRTSATAALRRSGFRAAAEPAAALTAEADRRDRDVFGRTRQADPEGYARAWLAAVVYLSRTERALVKVTWQPSSATPPHM
jgi:hypothetical protein